MAGFLQIPMEMKKLWALFCVVFLLAVFTAMGQEPGTELWEVPLSDGVFQTFTSSSPAIGDDGTIYVGSSDANGGGRLYAINPNGTTNWSFSTDGEIRSSPAIDRNGNIYFGTLSGSIVSLNTNGFPNWMIQTGDQVRSSPAIGADGTIYIGVGSSNVNNLYSLGSDGTTNWIFKMGVLTNYGDSEQFSSPAIGADGVIYVGSLDGRFYSIRPDDGTTNWYFDLGRPIYSSPTIGPDGTIYFGADTGGLYALAPDGTEKWSNYVDSYVETSPALDSYGNIFYGALGSSLICLGNGGSTLWAASAPNGISSSPAVAADGTVYTAAYYDTLLYAITPDQTNKWVFDAKGYFFASPAIAPDGTIYIVAGQKLFAIYETNGPASSVSPMFRRDRKHTARATQMAMDRLELLPDGTPRVNLRLEPGASYRLQASTDLVQWIDLTNFVSSSLSMQFIDTSATNCGQRFYRLASP